MVPENPTREEVKEQLLLCEPSSEHVLVLALSAIITENIENVLDAVMVSQPPMDMPIGELRKLLASLLTKADTDKKQKNVARFIAAIFNNTFPQ